MPGEAAAQAFPVLHSRRVFFGPFALRDIPYNGLEEFRMTHPDRIQGHFGIKAGSVEPFMGPLEKLGLAGKGHLDISERLVFGRKPVGLG